jgi:microcystin-dependent protein
MTTETNTTSIGANADAKFSSSTALGYNSVCTAINQIMLGTSAEQVVIPGNLSITGNINSISSDIFSKIQYLSTVSSNVQTQISNVASNKTFNSGLSASDITFTGSINNISQTVFGYLSNVSSNVQNQINTVSTNLANIGNNALVLHSTLNVSGFTTLTEAQVNTSLNVLQNINFLGSLNGITTNTFSFLGGLTSNIQNQINSITNTTPVGTVIQFAGSSASLNGYLPCDGTPYTISTYPNLYNAIQTMYGGDTSLGYFNVPNFKGVFLRGAGSQNLDLVFGSPAKQYSSPPLGIFVKDKSVFPSTVVTSINQNVKSFLERANNNVIGISFTSSNAVSSLNYTTESNNNVVETFPVHTSVQYFIKY